MQVQSERFIAVTSDTLREEGRVLVVDIQNRWVDCEFKDTAPGMDHDGIRAASDYCADRNAEVPL